MLEANIAAIATAPGKGGVAIIRISGKSPLAIAEKMFTPVGKTAVSNFEPYRMYPGTIQADGFSDYGLCVYFKAPFSYTGEDVVEFQGHGGSVAPRRVLEACFAAGARLARRGELTERAFLNGKIGLGAAEAVGSLLEAKNRGQMTLALGGLHGKLEAQSRKGRV